MSESRLTAAALSAILTLAPSAEAAPNKKTEADEAAKETCAVLGMQVERAIIAALYDKPETRAGVSYYADIQRKLTEQTCLADHGVAPKR